MTDEFIDILDENGLLTGEIRLKADAHRLGLFHASVHVWLYTVDGNILLQKRAHNKDTFPNLWDISVAGHIAAGETPKNSAIREIEEEIGVSLSEEELIFIGTYVSKKQPKPNFFDNEINHIYVSKFDTAIEELTLQEEEVAAVKRIPITDFKADLTDDLLATRYVPHTTEYYNFILKEIINRLD
ncbi:NUDIX domain-containing protein [Aquimarina sp. RZ0]|uniref:NUDIX hydrolase n=1 Tax=Aquimarina sp. RZ0 TaxID=2607730 RepID=UPI0011F3D556|nr:NUDIX domain-containing protein [Aquimarina sp. RZ0]KAA1246377.1 NUDIX domain-containing protein [Aquimarina sp. RZ0]